MAVALNMAFAAQLEQRAQLLTERCRLGDGSALLSGSLEEEEKDIEAPPADSPELSIGQRASQRASRRASRRASWRASFYMTTTSPVSLAPYIGEEHDLEAHLWPPVLTFCPPLAQMKA